MNVTEAQITALWVKIKAARRANSVEDPPDTEEVDDELDGAEGMLRALCPLCEPDDPE
jgi:hypothetical protein